MFNSISKRPWLVAISAMTVALMAVTFLAATTFAGQVQAQQADNDGMMSESMTVFTNATDSQGWHTIDGLNGWTHKAQDKELVIDVSLECGLYTDTEAKSKGGNKAVSVAEAGVQVRVAITPLATGADPLFLPGEVVFCNRSQTLMAEFQGLLTNEDGTVCLTVELNPDGTPTGKIIIDEACLEDESVRLILDTTNANAFNFVYRDLPQGDYYVEVQAKITSSGEPRPNGDPTAYATIGKGSAILTEVRFAKTN